MTIGHASSTVNAAVLKISAFQPTIQGRVSANGNVAYGNDYEFNLSAPGPNASCDTGIWVIQTATNCYVRCGINDSPNTTNQWYNTGGVGQGAPGTIASTGATIFTLGEQCDEVRINHTDNTSSGSPTFTTVSGSYTDNAFFTPTQDTKYGRVVNTFNSSSPEPSVATDGNIVCAITFRKAGLDDYTVSFTGRARSNAEWGF